MGIDTMTRMFDVGGGAAMAVDVCGQRGGPDVLLIHGIPGSRATWALVVGLLRGGARLVVPDLLGFGASADPPGDRHARGQADALRTVLHRLDVRSVHLVGFDFGGPIALTLYRDIRERVASLTLAATNAFTDTPIPGPLKLARVPVAGDALFSVMCSWPGLAAMWLGAVGDRRSVSFGQFARQLPGRRGRRMTRDVFLDSLRHLRARYAPVEATLRDVECPATVVWGDRDPFFPVAVGERTAAGIRGAQLAVLSGCGHFVPLERPQALAALIHEHLRNAGRRSLVSS